ncbi:MAG: sigma-70 family RNA polymerase sigma factor [Planctomycetota bacterium]|nr:sigma-70 family RNA polymerase sigma factor [Planctomycetota bacterium]MDA1211076.1 sigma-70 family RNA polymerase sigma factor [Planctomycetota bacterium]
MWPDSDETLELLKDAGDGDAGAVNQLLDRHRESLRRVIQYRLDRAIARRVDASDIVQEVLIEASRRLDDYLANPKLPFHLWLRQLAKDSLIDVHRKHKVAQRRSVDREQPMQFPATPDASAVDLLAQIRDLELTPAAATIRKELELRFLTALDELNDEDKEIILMRHVDQLENQEVSQLLGLTPPAAGMRYLRALRKLRSVLGESTSVD